MLEPATPPTAALDPVRIGVEVRLLTSVSTTVPPGRAARGALSRGARRTRERVERAGRAERAAPGAPSVPRRAIRAELREI
jgi:hypothetical protein